MYTLVASSGTGMTDLMYLCTLYIVVSFHVGRKPVVRSDLAESRYAGTSASTIQLNHRLSRIAKYMQRVKCGIIPHATFRILHVHDFPQSAFRILPVPLLNGPQPLFYVLQFFSMYLAAV